MRLGGLLASSRMNFNCHKDPDSLAFIQPDTCFSPDACSTIDRTQFYPRISQGPRP